MRIAFAGASGTGKTTLMNYVAELRGWPTCPVGARSVAQAMGFASPYDVDAAGRRAEFQRRLFEGKRAWEAAREHFVTDRSVFDCLAYLLVEGGARSLRDGEVDEYATAFLRYDAVVLMRMADFQDLTDPVRVQQRAYHEAYEAILFGFTRPEFRRRPPSWPEIWVLPYVGLDERKVRIEQLFTPF